MVAFTRLLVVLASFLPIFEVADAVVASAGSKSQKLGRVEEEEEQKRNLKKALAIPPPPPPPPKMSLAQVQRSGKDTKDQFGSQLTLPPDFWMWKTTPAPPTPPGPNPQLLWVAQTAPPLPTTGPLPEACYGCDCIYIDPTGTVAGGTFKNEFTCIGGAATVHVPNFKWAGAPVNSGVGHPLYQADGTQCLKSQSWAIHIEDLDYPYGVGQTKNHCHTHFWAVNIPGDWTEINEQLAHKTYKDLPLVTIGKNDGGTIGMEPPCPEYGVHRYRITLWALRSYLGTELDPVDPNQPFSQVLPVLQSQELAHSTFYANVKAEGYKPKTGFLQEASAWFQRHGVGGL